MTEIQINTPRLTIRPYTETDEQAMLALLTNDQIKQTYMLPDLTTMQQQTDMFRKLLTWSRSEEHLELGIYLKEHLIGFLNDVAIDAESIELGYAIHPRYHGMGYATEALKAVIEYFLSHGYREIIAGAFESNCTSIQVMRKCGMEQMERTDEIEYRGEIHHCVYFNIKIDKFRGH